MMKSSVVFLLTVSFAMFGSGLSLQCYSCLDGSASNCDVKVECSAAEDSCLKLTSGDQTLTACVRYSDCDFMTLAVRYPVPNFSFSCCQSELCNGPKKSLFQKFKDWLKN